MRSSTCEVAGRGCVNGAQHGHPLLIRAGAGTGKTLMSEQAVYLMAKTQLALKAENADGVVLIPLLIYVQRLVRLSSRFAEFGGDLVRAYVSVGGYWVVCVM